MYIKSYWCRWEGKCWYIHNLVKYEFDLNFEVRLLFPGQWWGSCQNHKSIDAFFLMQIPITYPTTPFEIVLPELDGKTAKMYR